MQVLCGACQRQPRVEGNCTRWILGRKDKRSLSREGVWDGALDIPQHRTFSEPSSRLAGLGEYARRYDTLYLTVAGEY